jgi:hypothetical protein
MPHKLFQKLFKNLLNFQIHTEKYNNYFLNYLHILPINLTHTVHFWEFIFYFCYIIVILEVHCDSYKTAYSIS